MKAFNGLHCACFQYTHAQEPSTAGCPKIASLRKCLHSAILPTCHRVQGASFLRRSGKGPSSSPEATAPNRASFPNSGLGTLDCETFVLPFFCVKLGPDGRRLPSVRPASPDRQRLNLLPLCLQS